MQTTPTAPRQHLEQRRRAAARGQSAVLLAIVFIGLIAFIGFALDVGILYVRIIQLRRAVDAAALGAAQEARNAATDDLITAAALQYIKLHGFNTATVTTELCQSPYDPNAWGNVGYDVSDPNYDAALCQNPPRRLVRVIAGVDVGFAFLPIIPGVPAATTIRANAIAESAALEVILIIDTSASMTWDANTVNGIDDDNNGIADDSTDLYYRDACNINTGQCTIVCNNINFPNFGANPNITSLLPSGSHTDGFNTFKNTQNACRPFEWVRNAALEFTENFVRQPFDRVAIIEFSNAAVQTYAVGETFDRVYQPLDSTAATNRVATLQNLRLLRVSPGFGDEGTPAYYTNAPDCFTYNGPGATPSNIEIFLRRPGPCQATNIGGALKAARQQLLAARQGALRFIILLSDGETNAADGPDYYCPNAPDQSVTLSQNNRDPFFNNRRCTDGDARNRNGEPANNFAPPEVLGGGVTYNNDPFTYPNDPIRVSNPAYENYDADDYARYWADEIRRDGNVIMFAIGLGDDVIRNPYEGAFENIGAAPGCTRTDHPADNSNWEGFFWEDPATVLKNRNGGNADCLPNGEQLMRYIADQGDGTGSIVCGLNGSGAANEVGLYMEPIGNNCGNYYFTADATQLETIFQEIAERIFTRITN